MIVAVILWGLHSYTTVVVDAEGAVLISTLVGALVGYFTPIAPGEIGVKPLAQPFETLPPQG
jgi:hypothetical protein